MQQRFFHAFAQQMATQGLSPEIAARHIWHPVDVNDAQPFAPGSREALNKLYVRPEELAEIMRTPHAPPPRTDKLALILVPGFTHETLRYRSWHETVDDRGSAHQITLLHPDGKGGTREEPRSQGPGFRIAYLAYPRSNADSTIIVPEMASMLKNSPTVQQWCREGRQLLFVGYSNGSPLSLELLAALNAGRLDAGGVLEATRGFLGLCGDIGGSYLADDVISETPKFISMRKVVDFAKRHPLVGKLIGLGTAQLREDMFGGVASLGHERRQQAIASYRNELPDHLHYFSVAAVLPLADYRRHWWQFNIDDLAMYKQALISDPVTPFNDGQVALVDNLVPSLDHVPDTQQHFMGAVRTHHWGVSYRTFNFGVNHFPRKAFYRALLQVIGETLDNRSIG